MMSKRVNFLSARKTYEKKNMAGKAVAICKDVLRLLNETNRLQPKKGVFIRLGFDKTKYKDKSMDARTFLRESTNTKACPVCAKGALLFTKILAKDKVSVVELDHPGSMSGEFTATNKACITTLNDAFEQKTLDMIEVAFEGYIPGYCSYTNLRSTNSDRWLTYYPDPNDRLRAIMKRVIKNGGTFTEDDVLNPQGS